MRIDPNAKLPEFPESKPLQRSTDAGRSVAAQRSGQGDEATLSAQARVQELQKHLEQMPEERQSRIAALTRAIREGDYKIEPEQIAQSLFSEMSAGSALLRPGE